MTFSDLKNKDSNMNICKRFLLLAAVALLMLEGQATDYCSMEDAEQSCRWYFECDGMYDSRKPARIYRCTKDERATIKRLDVPSKVYCVHTNYNLRIYHDVIGIEDIDRWSEFIDGKLNSVETFTVPDSLQYIDAGNTSSYELYKIPSLGGWYGLENVELGSSFRRFWKGADGSHDDDSWYEYEFYIGFAGSRIFKNCRNLTCFAVSSDNDVLESYRGVLYYKPRGTSDKASLLLCPPGVSGGVTIKDGTVRVGLYAFCDCSDLAYVTFPNTLKEIGESAFNGCHNLTSIILPDSIEFIGGLAFYDCYRLSRVEFPDAIDICTSRYPNYGRDYYYGGLIYRYPFSGCTNLSEIVFRGVPKNIDANTFKDARKDCVVYVPRYSTGWGVDIPGTWNGLHIEYIMPKSCKHNGKTSIINRRESTCTEAGHSGDSACYLCGEIMESGKTIPALGHNIGAGVVTKEPTVSEAGVMTYYCTRCGVIVKTASISKLDTAQVLCDCLGGLPYGSVTLGSSEVQWCRDSETTHNGKGSLCLMGNGDNSESSILFAVNGAGQLSFWWKASSEYDAEYDSVYDYAYLALDGVDLGGLNDDYKLFGQAIGGDMDWTNVVIDINGTGNHTIAWTYRKDEVDETIGFADCIWLEDVVWRPMVSATFALGGGSGSVPDSVAALSGAVITLPSAEGFSRDGHVFAGWSDGTYSYATGDSYTLSDSDIAFSAMWIRKAILTFALGGGTGALPTAIHGIPGKVISLPDANGIERDGYVFAGWSDGGRTYAAGESYTPGDSDVVFTATWTRKSILTFALGGGTGDAPAPIKVVPGTVVALPLASGFNNPRHTFAGWSDGSNTYAENATCAVADSDVGFTALWVAKTISKPTIQSPTVANGGVVTNAASVTLTLSADDGAALYYTLDGSTPTAESFVYTGPMELTDYAAKMKVIAIRDDYFDSEIAEFFFARKPYTPVECLGLEGVSDAVVSTGGDGEAWHRVLGEESHDGTAGLRSGAITHNQTNWVEVCVNGAGSLSFWWKASSEVVRGKVRDGAAFFVDGALQAGPIGGTDGDWKQVSHEVIGEGPHTLRWEFWKSAADSADIGEDCAWLDDVTWIVPCEVSDVMAKQRYPWNGLVDISCKVSGIVGTANGYKFNVAAVIPDSDEVRSASHVWVVRNGKNASDLVVCTNGDYHLLWDARADLGEVHYSNMVVRVTPNYKYNVTYSPGVSGIEPQQAVDKTPDAPLTLNGAMFTRAGYTQTGWSLSDGGAKAYDLGATYIANTSAILYPYWTAQTYTVIYNPGRNGIETQQVSDKTHDVAMILNGAMFTRDGYMQTGWAMSDGGAKAYDLGAAYTANTAIILYPYWTANTYTVTYNPGANGIGAQLTATKTHDVALTLNGAMFTRSGYTQTGWATSDGGAKAYDLGANYIVNAAVTLFPSWEMGKVQLWANGPYWSAINVGADKPEEYGYYFWWGDTIGYKRKNDVWVASDGSSSSFQFGNATSKQTSNKSISILQSEGWIVSQDVLAPAHDAARVQWGGDWRIPTRQEFGDLKKNCDWIWTTMNGVNGCEVRGRGDYASNSIFLPSDLYGGYWSSSFFADDSSWCLHISTYNDIHDQRRYCGMYIRPVQGNTVMISLNGNGGTPLSSSMSYVIGIAYGPLPTATRTGYDFDGWFTSASGGTRMTESSIVSGTVTVLYAHWTSKMSADAHEKVQLWEGGPYWATTNIGANAPEAFGWYFWWGDTVGYKREGYAWVATDGSSPNFQFDNDSTIQQTANKSISILQREGWIASRNGKYVLAPEHDAAHVKWGGDWRIPTRQEFVDLKNNCDWIWTTMNGVNGYEVRGRGDYAFNSIFLPCVGWGEWDWCLYFDSYGNYWSSVPYSDSDGCSSYAFGFDSSDSDTFDGYRNFGYPIRPVQGLAK